jgi:hypothetical protein
VTSGIVPSGAGTIGAELLAGQVRRDEVDLRRPRAAKLSSLSLFAFDESPE